MRVALWAFRIIFYGSMGLFAVTVIYPKGNGITFFFTGGIMAAIVMAIEIYISAKLTNKSFETEMKNRMVIVDKIMSKDPLDPNRRIEPTDNIQSRLEKGDNDVVDVEVENN